ncbi:hypothetical protein NDR87_18880 [Nocardia sp. CDC159]|uniref:Uncharacterized protein n=1 Tax=Nocardia pulmonis TaxID=2951408 RepID=A0A9X2IZ02_9NOCA|nr:MULTISPECIES: hypothetical protein [Nocardia]MCM6776244.1 hypothetical protein [Nocardia pulmonis]MCM6788430.1 hypothetical protein [Nocardia sp. CDC159]
MTARYHDHDEIAANALMICDDLRSQPLLQMYRGLAAECAWFPERMAQLLMCLAAWVDYDSPLSVLEERARAIVEFRIADAQGRVLSCEA